MKRNKMILGLAAGMALLLGFLYGNVCSNEKVPVYENTACYPERTLEEMVEGSVHIVVAEVVDIGASSVVEVPGILADSLPEGVICLLPLKTPITLKVNASMMGAEVGEEIVYYDDGGITEQYQMLSSGYQLEKGMEALFFIAEDGSGWGGQGILLVESGKVVLSRNSLDYFDIMDVSVLDVKTTNAEKVNGSNMSDVSAVDIEVFTAKINEMIQKKQTQKE